MISAKPTKKHRGVYEHPHRSGVWWILYYDQYGQRHREKVGLKSAAITQYRRRKTEVAQKKFNPEDIEGKHHHVAVAEVIDDYYIVQKVIYINIEVCYAGACPE
jgi:hypothetical protein